MEERSRRRRRRWALTEPIVGVEAAREAADGVEHVEAERAAELRRQAQQEAGDAAEVGPHRRGRRRGGPDHQPPPEHRGQRRELLRRRRAPYPAPAAPPPLGTPALLVLLVPGRGRRGHRGTGTRRFGLLPTTCLCLSRRDRNATREREVCFAGLGEDQRSPAEPRRTMRGGGGVFWRAVASFCSRLSVWFSACSGGV